MMPLYYFDFRQGDEVSEDTVGTECEGDADARLKAVRALAEIAADLPPARLLGAELAVLVRARADRLLSEARAVFHTRDL